MHRIVFVFAVALFGAIPALAAETVKAKVNGMVCAFCAQGIEAKLRKLPQTQDVYVNLGQKIVAVQVKAGDTLSPEVVRGVVKDAGYEVSSIETVSKTAKEIKAEIGKK